METAQVLSLHSTESDLLCQSIKLKVTLDCELASCALDAGNALAKMCAIQFLDALFDLSMYSRTYFNPIQPDL